MLTTPQLLSHTICLEYNPFLEEDKHEPSTINSDTNSDAPLSFDELCLLIDQEIENIRMSSNESHSKESTPEGNMGFDDDSETFETLPLKMNACPTNPNFNSLEIVPEEAKPTESLPSPSRKHYRFHCSPRRIFNSNVPSPSGKGGSRLIKVIKKSQR